MGAGLFLALYISISFFFFKADVISYRNQLQRQQWGNAAKFGGKNNSCCILGQLQGSNSMQEKTCQDQTAAAEMTRSDPPYVVKE